MIIKFSNYIGSLVKGSPYVIDNRINAFDLLLYVARRGLTYLRGVLFTKSLRRNIFIGKGVTIRNRRHFSVGKGVTLQDRVTIDALSVDGVNIGSNVNIGPMTIIQASGILTKLGKGLFIGNNSGIGAYSFIGCGGGVTIGSDVIMGQYISFHSENHIYGDLQLPIRMQGVTREGIVIENNCWVGARVTFLDGTHVGEGCVIAAGSVVRGTIPPRSVIAGIPARVIKSRE